MHRAAMPALGDVAAGPQFGQGCQLEAWRAGTPTGGHRLSVADHSTLHHSGMPTCDRPLQALLRGAAAVVAPAGEQPVMGCPPPSHRPPRWVAHGTCAGLAALSVQPMRLPSAWAQVVRELARRLQAFQARCEFIGRLVPWACPSPPRNRGFRPRKRLSPSLRRLNAQVGRPILRQVRVVWRAETWGAACRLPARRQRRLRILGRLRTE